MEKIAVIGLGYVGLPLAIEFAKRFQVVGFDIDEDRVNQLSAGFDVTFECSVEQLLAANRLEYTSNPSDIANAHYYIVTVPTPIDTDKKPDLSPLQKASELVGKFLSKENIVIYESTVYPGATEEVCVPILEKASGLRYNEDFFCGYSPERINPGDKKNTLPTIVKITSGSNPEVATMVDDLYASIIKAGTFRASSIRVAEAAKVIENCQRDLNIAFVNELSVLFNHIGLDTQEVLEAAGSKWNFLQFKPGMVGGHCIGVDPYYLISKAESVGYEPKVLKSGRQVNDNMAIYAAQSVVKKMKKNGLNIASSTVAVLGITFKENCPDIRNSKILDLVKELQDWVGVVNVYDAWADAQKLKNIHDIELKSFDEGMSCDSIIVAVGHDEYRSLTAEELRAMCSKEGAVCGDLKSLFDRNALLSNGFDVFRL